MRKRLLAVLLFCMVINLCIPSGYIPEGRADSVTPSETAEIGDRAEKGLRTKREMSAGKGFDKHHVGIDASVRESCVKLYWNHIVSISCYLLYRRCYNEKRKTLLARLPKNKTSYTDKKAVFGKRYVYTIECVKETKGGAVKLLTTDAITVPVGPGMGNWYRDESNVDDPGIDTTPRYIKIAFTQYGYPMKHDGFEIYRGKTEKKMKRIAVVKTAKGYEGKSHVTYKDKNVKPLASYYYKVRPYKKMGGKIGVGTFTDAKYLIAGNSSGKQSSHIIKITSNKGNYDFQIDKYLFSRERPGIEVVYRAKENFSNVQFSYDGINWRDFTEQRMNVSRGESIYLLLRKKDDRTFRLNKKIILNGFYYLNQMKHNENGHYVLLQMDFRKNNPTVRMEYMFGD